MNDFERDDKVKLKEGITPKNKERFELYNKLYGDHGLHRIWARHGERVALGKEMYLFPKEWFELVEKAPEGLYFDARKSPFYDNKGGTLFEGVPNHRELIKRHGHKYEEINSYWVENKWTNKEMYVKRKPNPLVCDEHKCR